MGLLPQTPWESDRTHSNPDTSPGILAGLRGQRCRDGMEREKERTRGWEERTEEAAGPGQGRREGE